MAKTVATPGIQEGSGFLGLIFLTFFPAFAGFAFPREGGGGAALAGGGAFRAVEGSTFMGAGAGPGEGWGEGVGERLPGMVNTVEQLGQRICLPDASPS